MFFKTVIDVSAPVLTRAGAAALAYSGMLVGTIATCTGSYLVGKQTVKVASDVGNFLGAKTDKWLEERQSVRNAQLHVMREHYQATLQREVDAEIARRVARGELYRTAFTDTAAETVSAV